MKASDQGSKATTVKLSRMFLATIKQSRVLGTCSDPTSTSGIHIAEEVSMLVRTPGLLQHVLILGWVWLKVSVVILTIMVWGEYRPQLLEQYCGSKLHVSLH